MLGFGFVMHIWQFGIIDEMSDPEAILAHLNQMSPSQKTVHAWMTATLDVAFPFAYGSLFIGMALRHFQRFGPLLVWSNLVLIAADLTEGFIQVLLLNGHENIVWAKAIVTPLKLGLFIFGLMVTLIGLTRALFLKRKAGDS